MNAHSDVSPRNYLLVWLALIALLLFTLASAYWPMGWLNTAVHLGVTVTQAALVLLFSMHLRSAHPLLRVIAVVGFFGIAILIALTLADVLTR